jgi:uncharacterized protein YjbI with pentapeptide repeats
MASKSPVLARIAEGAKGLPDSLQATMDEHGRIVLDDLQFGPEALAALLAFCASEELDLRSLTAAQRVEACRCADFYDMCASYRTRVGAALLTTLDGESAEATEIDFAMVPLTLGPLVQSVSISNVTIRNLNLARCHIGAASFRDCNIENCTFEASVSTTTLAVEGCSLQQFQCCSHCAQVVTFSSSNVRDCRLRGGKEVKLDGCTLTDVQLARDDNDCRDWTLEMSKCKVTSFMEVPASSVVLCDVSFGKGCRLTGGRDVKLKSCVLVDIQFSCSPDLAGHREREPSPTPTPGVPPLLGVPPLPGVPPPGSGCKIEVSECVVAAPIELPARASILLDDVIFNDGAWFSCESARITRWQQVRIDGPVKLEDVTFNDRVEGAFFSPGSKFDNCNFEFGMGNVAAVECTFTNCKMDSAMKNYHMAHCNFVGSYFENCAFLPNYPNRGATLYESEEASNFSFARFKQCTLFGRTAAFKFGDQQLSAAWNLHQAQLV